jgi:hypothetical protein
MTRRAADDDPRHRWRVRPGPSLCPWSARGRLPDRRAIALRLPPKQLPRRRLTDLIVPAANLTGRDPVEFAAIQRIAVERVLNSDAWFWAYATLAPDMLLRTLLATDPALLDKVSPKERRRADLIREGLMPISHKTDG